MPKIIRTEKEFKKLPKSFFKMPVAFIDNYYIGVAKFKGQYKLHNHNSDELIYVVNGALKMQVNKRKYSLNAGDAVLIKKGEEHVSHSEVETQILIFESQDIVINFLEDDE
jgi:mannose-6-phosphate isomerase-like protein (cupin superfamily)